MHENESNVVSIRNQLQKHVFKRASQIVLNPFSRDVFNQLTACHTAIQGVHRLRCKDTECLHEHFQYHNCGNRHCPNCGGMRREQWIEDKTSELLPTSYFHVVFTVPHELNSLTMGNRKLMFDLLFEASSYTLLKLAKDEKWLGATPGIISILHTWGQDLCFHPHVHCIVSGGGVQNLDQKDGALKWIKERRSNHKYLFPKPAIQSVYKAYYLKRLRSMLQKGLLQVEDKRALENSINEIEQKLWNVYAKAPFGGPLQVLEYLGRYTHKVAITPHRILEINDDESTIKFKYKDYHKRNSKDEQQEMTVPIDEFIRRYEQHILPKRYTKIRHYGYLKNYRRKERLKQLFELLELPPAPPKVKIPIRQRMLEKYGKDILLCPKCERAQMELVATYRKGILFQVYDGADSNADAVRNKASP